jgi:hypothetical protein
MDAVVDAQRQWPLKSEIESLIGPNTVGLLYIPSDYAEPRAGLLAVWRRHLVANAEVRSREYMEALFTASFPKGGLVEVVNGQIPTDRLEGADTIVLLFPDSIGIDFGKIERAIYSRWPSKRVLALNGRRRLFRLDPEMRRRLALRHFLETYRLPELAFLVIFVLVTPFLVLLDLLRGRR